MKFFRLLFIGFSTLVVGVVAACGGQQKSEMVDETEIEQVDETETKQVDETEIKQVDKGEKSANGTLICGQFSYSTCPEGCTKKCTPSNCSETGKRADGMPVITCTDDCEGPGSCVAK
jgi:hypothetical protein